MKLGELLELQKVLDSEIAKEHGLTAKDLLEEKILALRVELAELANETRCFKFWSYKPASGTERILEEFSDCLHFILSIVNEVGFPITKYEFFPYIQNTDNIVEQFNACFHILGELEDSDYEYETIEYLINNFLGLAEMLDLTSSDIANAYLEKNKINHERLSSGY